MTRPAETAAGTVVARRTMTAMMKAGPVIHSFSLVVLGGAALLAAAWAGRPVAVFAGPLCLVTSFLAALVATYYAVRVRIDADVLGFLDESENAPIQNEEREAGIGAVRSSVPPILGRGMAPPNPEDPLDAHRRSVKLLLRLAAWTAIQAFSYGAAVLVGA